MTNLTFKNPYVNFSILFVALILFRANELSIGLGLWFFDVNIIFSYLVYFTLFSLILINAIFFFKKYYIFGLFQILIWIFLLLFITLVNLINPISLIDYIRFPPCYGIKIEVSPRNDHYIFTQRNRLLYFFATEHCIHSYRIFPGMTGWEKIDNDKLRINNKIITLTKGHFFNDNSACINNEN